MKQKAILKNVLSREAVGVGITHDMWTSNATEGYGTVTAHFISKSWELETFVLQTRVLAEAHTSENLARDLRCIKDEWGLPDKIIATTDNASNEVKAFEILKWPRLSCIGHNLNLAVTAALKCDEVDKIITRCRKVVAYFHRSPLAMQYLKDKQRLLLSPEKQNRSLLQDVATRWNSTYDMLDRLVEQTPAVHAVLLDPAIKGTKAIQGYIISANDQIKVEKVLDFLKPFYTLTTALSSETKSTLPALLPATIQLTTLLQPKTAVPAEGSGSESDDTEPTTDPGWIVKMKEAAMKSLNKRYTDTHWILSLSSMLHPKTKHLTFLSKDDRAATRAKLTEETFAMLRFAEDRHTAAVRSEGDFQDAVDPPQAQGANAQLPDLPAIPQMKLEPGVTHPEPDLHGPPLKKVKVEADPMDVIDLSFGNEEEASADDNSDQLIHDEINRYCAEKSAANADPLQWWKEREGIYPHVAAVAKVYLALPASSVPSERIFSLAGNIVSKKRASLSPSNVDMLIFLHKNFKTLSKFGR